jgi:hypothetical protein
MMSEKSSEKVARMENFLHENCREFNYELNVRTTIENQSLNWGIWKLQILLRKRASTKRTDRIGPTTIMETEGTWLFKLEEVV